MCAVDTTDNPTSSVSDTVSDTVNDMVNELIAAVIEQAPEAPTALPGTAAPEMGALTAQARQRRTPRHLSQGRQYARFLMVGVSNAVVDLAVLNALLWADPTRNPLTLVAYNTLAVALAILNSYLWNTRWTFRAEATHTQRERLLFIGQAIINILVNNLVLLGATALLPPTLGGAFLIWSNVAKLAAMIVASTLSFLLLRAVVFHHQSQ